MFGKVFGKSQFHGFGKMSGKAEAKNELNQVWVHSLNSIGRIPAETLTQLPANTYPNFRPHWMPQFGRVVPFHLDDYPQQFCMHEYDDNLRAHTNKTFPTLPEFFDAVAVPCLAQKYAAVIMQHNLGESRFFPVTVFKHDGKTLYPGEYFGIYFGETKAAVSYPESTGLKIFNSAVGPLFEVRIVPEDGQFAVRKSALDELDLWIDPQCGDVFFISGRLKLALDEVGLTADFKFKSCRMI